MENNNNSFLYFFMLIGISIFAFFIIRSTFHLDYWYSIQTNTKHKKKYLILGLVLPLIILFIFKYFNFISDVLRIDLQIQFLLELFYQ